MSLLFALGAANALLQGLLSGSFSGRKGATFPLHGSPVWFVVIACFFGAVTLCFLYLAYRIFLAGPNGVQRDADALQESRDRQRRRQKAALKSSRVPYVIAAVLLVISAGMGVAAKQPSVGFEGLLAGVAAFATAFGAVVALSLGSNRVLARAAQAVLVLVVLAALVFK